jgi:hypothetical protein
MFTNVGKIRGGITNFVESNTKNRVSWPNLRSLRVDIISDGRLLTLIVSSNIKHMINKLIS